MRFISARFDARLWGFIIVGVLSVGFILCLGTAAMALTESVGGSGGIVSVSEALREMDARGAAAARAVKIRQGVTTERLPQPDLSVAAGSVDQISP